MSKKLEHFMTEWIMKQIKVFDRINHHFLITKMEGMDIHPIRIACVRNFLTGRKQRVKIGKFVSSL